LAKGIQGEMSLSILLLVNNGGGESLFIGLSLENLFFDCAGRYKAVDKAFLLLTITPDTGQRLLIRSWVPVFTNLDSAKRPTATLRLTRIEKNQAIRPDQINTTTSSLATQQEYEFLAFRIVKLIDELLSFWYSHGTIQSEVTIPNWH
jgi:hypothetical protein